MVVVLGFQLTPRLLSASCESPSIWLKCRVPEGSAGEIHWAIHAWRLLDRLGFGREHSCFSLAV